LKKSRGNLLKNKKNLD